MKKFYLIYFVCGLSIIALIYYFNYGSYNMTIDRMKKDLTSHYSEKRYVEKNTERIDSMGHGRRLILALSWMMRIWISG